MPILNLVGCSGQACLQGFSGKRGVFQIRGGADVIFKRRVVVMGAKAEGGDGQGNPSMRSGGDNALDVIETGAVATSVCLATASVLFRNGNVSRNVLGEKTGLERGRIVSSKKEAAEEGRACMTMADQLAIWTIVPLSIAAACRLLIRHFQKRKAWAPGEDVGPQLLRMDERMMIGRKEIKALDEQVERMRMRLKIVHRSLREGVNELSGESSLHEGKLVALAEEMDTIHVRLQAYDDVLLKMQDASLRQFTALVQAVERIETKVDTVEHVGAVQEMVQKSSYISSPKES